MRFWGRAKKVSRRFCRRVAIFLLWGMALCITAILVLEVGLVVSMKPAERYFYRSLAQVVNKAQGKSEIPMVWLTNFQWDKVRFLGPYGGHLPRKFVVLNGKEYVLRDHAKVDLSNDSAWALVFVKGNAIVAIIRARRLTLFPNSHQYLHCLAKKTPNSMLGKQTKMVVGPRYRFYLKEEN